MATTDTPKTYPLMLIDNYIYLFHTDEYLIIPQYPETINDTLSSTFAQQNALSRTAPVFAYSYSGPRTVQVTLSLHRDMINAVNISSSNLSVDWEGGDDYIDTLVKKLQAIALPKYNAAKSAIVPPMIAVRFGETIFIKGIVNGGISLTYKTPILENNKYAQVEVSFTVSEITPYDADSVSKYGSFRGITRQFKDGIYND